MDDVIKSLEDFLSGTKNGDVQAGGFFYWNRLGWHFVTFGEAMTCVGAASSLLDEVRRRANGALKVD